MNLIRRTLEIDTDARLRDIAAERGQNVSAVLAEAVALLKSVVDIAGPDIAEDRRRLDGWPRYFGRYDPTTFRQTCFLLRKYLPAHCR